MELSKFIDTLAQTLASAKKSEEKIKISIFYSLFSATVNEGKILESIPLLLEEGQKFLSPQNMAQVLTSGLYACSYNLKKDTAENEVLLINFIKKYSPFENYAKYLKSRVENNHSLINMLSSPYYAHLGIEDKDAIQKVYDFVVGEYKTIFYQELINSKDPAIIISDSYQSLINQKCIYQISELIDLIKEVRKKIPDADLNDIYQNSHYTKKINNYDLAKLFLLSPVLNQTHHYYELFEVLNIDFPTLYERLAVSDITYFFRNGDIQLVEKSFSYISTDLAYQAFEHLCGIGGIKKGRGHRIVEKLVKMSVDEPEKVYLICTNLEDKIKQELNLADSKFNGYEALLSFIKKNLPKSKTLQQFESSINQMHSIQSIYEQKRLEQSVSNVLDIKDTPKKKMKI
jgi:hypothetical protein